LQQVTSARLMCGQDERNVLMLAHQLQQVPSARLMCGRDERNVLMHQNVGRQKLHLNINRCARLGLIQAIGFDSSNRV